MYRPSLTLDQVAENPEQTTFPVLLPNGSEAKLRPLVSRDAQKLATFFHGLSENTRRFYSFSGSATKHAQELCQAINRYDKLRYVIETQERETEIIGLVEFSFAILEADTNRYLKSGIYLDQDRDCRYGMCLSDAHQNQRLGSLLFEYVKQIASLFGKERIILWGGVYSDNDLAIGHYRRNGFEELGEFENLDGKKCLDMLYNLGKAQPNPT